MMAGLRDMVEDAAVKQGLSLSIRYQAQQILTVAGLVEARQGIGIVPRLAAEALEGGPLRVLPLAAPKGLTRQVGILTRRGSSLSPLALELERIFAAMLDQRNVVMPPGKPASWSGPVDTV
jgi:DNA-binding transcriptional LysR family regulator